MPSHQVHALHTTTHFDHNTTRVPLMRHTLMLYLLILHAHREVSHSTPHARPPRKPVLIMLLSCGCAVSGCMWMCTCVAPHAPCNDATHAPCNRSGCQEVQLFQFRIYVCQALCAQSWSNRPTYHSASCAGVSNGSVTCPPDALMAAVRRVELLLQLHADHSHVVGPCHCMAH
jgi:hypothetical protein